MGRIVCCLVLDLHTFYITSSYCNLTRQRSTYQVLFSITHVHERGSRWRSSWVARGRTSVGEGRLTMIRWWVRSAISIARTSKASWSLSVPRPIIVIRQTAKHVAAKMAWFYCFSLYSPQQITFRRGLNIPSPSCT